MLPVLKIGAAPYITSSLGQPQPEIFCSADPTSCPFLITYNGYQTGDCCSILGQVLRAIQKKKKSQLKSSGVSIKLGYIHRIQSTLSNYGHSWILNRRHWAISAHQWVSSQTEVHLYTSHYHPTQMWENSQWIKLNLPLGFTGFNFLKVSLPWHVREYCHFPLKRKKAFKKKKRHFTTSEKQLFQTSHRAKIVHR